MSNLKIHRVNKSKLLVKDGKKVVRECSSFKQAMNALINEDLLLLDNVDEFCNAEIDDMELIFDLQAVA